MSEDVECFNTGSIISCISCHGTSYEGEVIAFDQGRKVLAIKCPSNAGQLHDVHLINLNNVTDVKLKKDVKKEDIKSSSPPHFNTNKIEERKRKSIEERRRLANAFESGVTDEGLEMFLHLYKTINQVTWEGKNIIVMKDICISPPYKSENCGPRSDSIGGDKRNVNSSKTSEAVAYIKTIVEKYWKDCK